MPANGAPPSDAASTPFSCAEARTAARDRVPPGVAVLDHFRNRERQHSESRRADLPNPRLAARLAIDLDHRLSERDDEEASPAFRRRPQARFAEPHDRTICKPRSRIVKARIAESPDDRRIGVRLRFDRGDDDPRRPSKIIGRLDRGEAGGRVDRRDLKCPPATRFASSASQRVTDALVFGLTIRSRMRPLIRPQAERFSQWRAMSSRRAIQTPSLARIAARMRSSAPIRPGRPMILKCSPTDIIFGACAPSRYSQSNASRT